MNNNKEKELRRLKKRSAGLTPDSNEREALQIIASQYANRFYDSEPASGAYREFDDTIKNFLEDPLNEEGTAPESLIQQIENVIARPGVNLISGRHFGYIPGGGLPTAAVGDYLASVTNLYAGVYASSPGAVLAETRLIKWMCGLIGYDENSGGYLSSGGSHANLSAIVAARDDAGLKAADYSKAVVYLTTQTHHCVERALNIAGMRECVRRSIPTDETFRMRPAKLEEQIEKDRIEGLKPWMVVASAGSTDTGAVDPLETIGTIAAGHHLWYHVDAAYGGFFLLTDDGKKKLKGIGVADSVVMDPHKGLFLPYGTGALLVKDVDKLAASFHFDANYMKYARKENEIYSPAEISPELSKHFRGLRMWLPLKLHGLQVFRSALEEKLLLAAYLWEKLSEMDDIQVGPEPQLSVFIFRWKPDFGNSNELNRELHQSILKQGRIFLSTTEIDGEFYFRVAVLSVRSHIEEAEEFLSVLRDKIGDIQSGYSKPS